MTQQDSRLYGKNISRIITKIEPGRGRGNRDGERPDHRDAEQPIRLILGHIQAGAGLRRKESQQKMLDRS